MSVHNEERQHNASFQYYIFLPGDQSAEEKRAENYKEMTYSHNGFSSDNMNINLDRITHHKYIIIQNTQ